MLSSIFSSTTTSSSLAFPFPFPSTSSSSSSSSSFSSSSSPSSPSSTETSKCSSISPPTTGLSSATSSSNGFGIPTKVDAAHKVNIEQVSMVTKTTKRIHACFIVTRAPANAVEISSVRALNIRRTISVWFDVVCIGTPMAKIPNVFGIAFGAISSSSLNLE